MPVSLSAPGKLVLLGEYAVLFGAPAVVLAVDRRARVDLAATRDGRWSVAAPGLRASEAHFELAAGGEVRWARPSDGAESRLPLVEGLLGAMAANGSLDAGSLRPAAMALDTRAFFAPVPGGHVKLGLGSSAALTVALASALALWAGRDDLVADRPRWLQALVRLHRGLQEGRGSGLDVAASLLGGCVEYRLDRHGEVATADPLPLVSDLHLAFVWTGRPADTGSFLQRLDQRRANDDGAVARALDRLADASDDGVAAFRDGGVAAVLDAIDRFGDALDALGRDAGLEIVSAEHRELGRLARRHGAHYKPSGAGGGDLGVVFATDPAVTAATVADAAAAGFRALDLRVDPLGLAPPAV